MAYIYAYEPDCYDCASIGLVGALMDQDARFELRAGEFGELSFTHPIDPWGKWQVLQDGVILKTLVPVRLVPEVDDGAYVGTVRYYRVSQAATKYQRYIYYAETSSKDPTQTVTRNKRKYQKTKHKKLLKKGTKVIVVADKYPSNPQYRYKVRVGSGKGKVVGYMEKAGLTLIEQDVPVAEDQTGLEQVDQSYSIQQQLFRIYEVETNTGTDNPGSITVHARRLVYDLLGNVCTYKATANISCQTAATRILENTTFSHPFSVYSDIADKHIGLDMRNINPLAALIDPDVGLIAHYGGEVVCDDYDIYILHRAGMDRGVGIRYGKNLTGVNCHIDTSNVATAIRPVGEKANGEPLYLDIHKVTVSGQTRYGYNYSNGSCADLLPVGYRWAIDDDETHKSNVVERDLEWDGYAVPKAAVLDVPDARVTKKTKGTDPSQTSVITDVEARVMMAQAAVAAFESGCDVPDVSLEVNFTMLGDTEEYAQYKHLEPLFVYDTVHVAHPRVAVKADINLMSITWLVREERVEASTFGSLGDAIAQIPGWQISNLDGGRIVPGTINSGQISTDAISAEHLQVESVNADAIQARSITADHVALNTLKAENIKAGEIEATMLSAFNAVIQNLDAGHVEADTLDAAAAYIATLEAGFAEFTRAQITNLVANALTLDFGTLDEVFITNLSVLYAQVVNATIGNLCLKASDGVYYLIDVGSDGTVTATAKSPQPTQAEIEAGVTTAGQHIVETSVTAQEMSTQTLHATFELVSKIDASRIDVDSLVARQAFIDRLAAAEIIGESTIRMIAGQAQQAGAIQSGGRIFRDTPEPPYAVNDLWLQADENELYICVTAKGQNETYDEDDWVISNAHDMTARTIRNEVNAMVEVDTDGLHVKGTKLESGQLVGSDNEVVVTPQSVNIVHTGQTYSQFAKDYVQFGGYQLRRAADGGLVFKLK